AKGRARIASLAARASRSKTAIEKPGREYLRHLKEQPKIIEAELRRFVIECDEIRDETRRPLTEWEAEQDRLKQEAEAKKKAEQLAAEIEVAHEMALLMNDAFDRDAKAKAEEVERLRKAHEEFIAQQAAEKAKREVEEKAKRDIEAAEQRERDAKLAQERAEQKVEQDKKDAATKAEREKQEAIAAEKLKAQQEAERVQREAKQKEDARLAEEKRVADEAAKRAANEKHRKAVGTEIVAALLGRTSITREQAIEVLIALKDEEVPHTRINY
ncbi:TPA: hypothetical protein ACF1IQ_004477, partial [Yersinia enterocolitica]